jgi:RNA polymerase sigma-70 factor, ECF subfamily
VPRRAKLTDFVFQRARSAHDGEIESNLPDLAKLDDNSLVEEFLSGRSDALAELFGRHKTAVFLTARRILGNDNEAEEVLQYVFLELQSTLCQFDKKKSALKTWLVRKTTFRAINRKGYLHARGFYCSEEITDAVWSAPESTILGLNEQELVYLVDELLSELSAEELEVVTLVYFQGLTLEEASKKTSKTLGTLRYMLARSFEELRVALSRREESRDKHPAAKEEELP